ncbi:putative 3'-5' exonuclease related to the exonuclease domain of PolB [bacterium BMS3Bbin04]|nr:putative 3'-5' exonuclease related to the exonuclease domain of PolB [bacterium BMS3Bbin04]
MTEKVVGYEKRSTAGRDKISDHELDLPPVVYESVGLWFEPPQSAIAGLLQEKRHPMGSLHASEHASLALIPLFALCDRNDLGGISFTRHAGTGGAAVFLYDGHPGGLGLANRAYAVLDELFMRVLKMVRDCPCEDGCPSCVHSPKCGHGNQPLDKEGCIRLLEHLTGGPELKADETLAELTFGTEGNAQTKPLGWPGSERGSHSERSEESRGSAPTENERSLQKTPRMTNEETGDTEMNEAQNSKKYESQTPFCEGRDIVVYDLETQLSANDVGGWQNIHLMRVAIGVIYERKTGKYLVYREEDCEALIARLEQAELVVGYNNKRFDNTVLTAYTDHDLRGMNNLDLLEEISNRHGFRMKLDALAQATLNAKKTADGLQSLQWWKEGEVDKIIEYCKMDVEVTWKLFEYMCEHGYALCERKGELAKLPVELPLKRIMGEPDLFSGLM